MTTLLRKVERDFLRRVSESGTNNSLSNDHLSIQTKGSAWGSDEQDIFRIIRHNTVSTLPPFLSSFEELALSIVAKSKEMQTLLRRISGKKLQTLPQCDVEDGPFQFFLILLNQVMEPSYTFLIAGRRRSTRAMSKAMLKPQEPGITGSDDESMRSTPPNTRFTASGENSETEGTTEEEGASQPQESSSPSLLAHRRRQKRPRSASSSPQSTLARKKTNIHRQPDGETGRAFGGDINRGSDSDSNAATEPSSPDLPKHLNHGGSQDAFEPEARSDQDAVIDRSKSEAATNACLYELLRSVTELARPSTAQNRARLEWNIAFNTFVCTDLGLANLRFSTTNDGGIVAKGLHEGHWQRTSEHCFCSLEAKSMYHIDEKSSNVRGQEAAHLIGMYWQRAHTEGFEDKIPITIPLFSMSQSRFSLVYCVFPVGYSDYLRNGVGENIFAHVYEYGPWNLSDEAHLKRVLYLIIMLHIWAEEERESLSP